MNWFLSVLLAVCSLEGYAASVVKDFNNLGRDLKAADTVIEIRESYHAVLDLQIKYEHMCPKLVTETDQTLVVLELVQDILFYSILNSEYPDYYSAEVFNSAITSYLEELAILNELLGIDSSTSDTP